MSLVAGDFSGSHLRCRVNHAVCGLESGRYTQTVPCYGGRSQSQKLHPQTIVFGDQKAFSTAPGLLGSARVAIITLCRGVECIWTPIHHQCRLICLRFETRLAGGPRFMNTSSSPGWQPGADGLAENPANHQSQGDLFALAEKAYEHCLTRPFTRSRP